MNIIVAVVIFLSGILYASEDIVLKNILKKEVSGYQGIVGIYYKNLKTRSTVEINANTQFPAASIIKIPVMIAAFEKINKGQVQRDKKVTITKKDVIGGSGILYKQRNHAVGQERTILDLITLMIILSDNMATNKIVRIISRNYVNYICTKYGLYNTKMNRMILDFAARNRGRENWTTPKDMGKALELIHYNKVCNSNISREMMSILLQQKIRGRLPGLLPAGTPVANKTGTENSIVGDVGIIYSPKGPYLCCILIKGFPINRSGKAKRQIAELSKIIYDYVIQEKNKSNKENSQLIKH
ncbi:MAG: serine hydrolase [Candidatus Coatesbacteria bacterium]|nr:serine hydrolase [Candidatus Coatesbacteria bacterium]